MTRRPWLLWPLTYPEIPPFPTPAGRFAGTGPTTGSVLLASTLHLDYSAEHPTDDITAEISCG